MLLVSLNTEIKSIMWDTLDPDSYGALIFKSTQSAVSIFISYNAIKYFTVSTVGIVCSTMPLFAVFLAWLWLSERVSVYDVVAVMFVVACVISAILGAEGEQQEALQANIWAMVLLGFQPLLLAGGMIASRKMKRNHAFSLTCYTNILLVLTSAVAIKSISRISFHPILELDLKTWGLLCLSGFMTIFEHVGKILAFRYYRAAPL